MASSCRQRRNGSSHIANRNVSSWGKGPIFQVLEQKKGYLIGSGQDSRLWGKPSDAYSTIDGAVVSNNGASECCIAFYERHNRVQKNIRSQPSLWMIKSLTLSLKN